MKDLIERLEKATGPDRELEVAICRAVYPEANVEQKLGGWYFERNPPGPWQIVPRYMESVDAALTLVPEGYDWDVGKIEGNGGYTSHVMFTTVLNGEQVWMVRGTSKGMPTPALALCIVALKARQQANGQE